MRDNCGKIDHLRFFTSRDDLLNRDAACAGSACNRLASAWAGDVEPASITPAAADAVLFSCDHRRCSQTQDFCPKVDKPSDLQSIFMHTADNTTWDCTGQTNKKLHAVHFTQAAIVLTKAFLQFNARHVGAQNWWLTDTREERGWRWRGRRMQNCCDLR